MLLYSSIDADSMEEQSPMFPICGRASQNRYCSINFGIDNPSDKYLYYSYISTINGSIFIQPNELSPVDNFIINYDTRKVTISEALYNVALAELQDCVSFLTPAMAEYTFGLGTDYTLPLRTWNAFENIAFADAYFGNNDTFLNLADILSSFPINDLPQAFDLFMPLFSTEVASMIKQLAKILKACNYGTIEGNSIFDPILWILLEAVFDNFDLFNDLIPNAIVNHIEGRVCDAYVEGFHYIFSDYLFTDGINTNYTAFTLEDTLNSGGSGCVSSQTFNFRNQ